MTFARFFTDQQKASGIEFFPPGTAQTALSIARLFRRTPIRSLPQIPKEHRGPRY
jgi:hypothetical protein